MGIMQACQNLKTQYPRCKHVNSMLALVGCWNRQIVSLLYILTDLTLTEYLCACD